MSSARTRLFGRLVWAALLVSTVVSAQSLPGPNNRPANGNAIPATPPRDAGYSPEVNYQLGCAGCHLSDARGASANDVPRMKDFLGHFLEVRGGRQYLVRVPGVSQSGYTDAQIADLLNWMLTGAIAGDSTPDDFRPYTAKEVVRLRARPLEKTHATRATLIRRMRNRGIAIADGISDRP